MSDGWRWDGEEWEGLFVVSVGEGDTVVGGWSPTIRRGVYLDVVGVNGVRWITSDNGDYRD